MNSVAVFFLFFGCLIRMDLALPVDTLSYNVLGVATGNLSKCEKGTVSSSTPVSYAFTYNPQEFLNRVVRVNATSNNATSRNPIIMVVRRELTVESWTIPLLLQNISFYTISRTLCPLWAEHRWTSASTAMFYIDLSTTSPVPLQYSFVAFPVEEFTLSLSHPHSFQVTPSSPVFFQYNFTSDDHDAVMVKVTSPDDICAVVSVQHAQCPVRVLPSNVRYKGQYQTMETKSALTVKRKGLFEDGVFFVVVVVLPDNTSCKISVSDPLSMSSAMESGRTSATIQQKRVSVVIEKALTTRGYDRGIGASVGIYLAFYVLAFLVLWLYWYIEKRHGGMDRTVSFCSWFAGIRLDEDAEGDNTTLIESSSHREAPNYNTFSARRRDGSAAERPRSIEISAIMRQKQEAGQDIVVSDLARGDRKPTSQKYRQYAWTLFTVGLFYSLPAVQLVIAYQQELHKTGDEDMCYYNFLCAHPAGILSDFNHVWSNIGYALLGVLFFLIAYQRSRLYYSRLRQFGHKGIPQYFGLYYAMAFGLFMEGIMSGTYHICPNKANFQFDTSFMYVIAGMCMLKLYQSRHPDIETSAYRAFFAFGIVILLALFGVLYNCAAFWGVFFALYMITIVFVNVEIYYMGRWSFVKELFTGCLQQPTQCLCQYTIRGCLTCSCVHYRSRWVLLLLATSVNLGIGIWGISSFYPDFATYVLIIMISNLAVYFLYYIFMKLAIAHEWPSFLTWITAFLAIVCWAPALYFFNAGLTDWQASPAESRQGNANCILFDFYDAHDVWHFLSALGMFFSFLTILTVDDDIKDKNRDTILAF